VPPVSNHGLLGEYYPNDHWQGQPVMQRIDPFLDSYFHFTPMNRPYSVIWSGSLVVPQSGLYRFGVMAVAEAELLIDGQPVVKTLAPNQLQENMLTLEAGNHEIMVRFKDTMDRSQIHLYWMTPTGTFQPIPTQYLWPPLGEYPIPTEQDSMTNPTENLQSLTLEWVNSIGTFGNELGQFHEPRDVAVLSNGNLVVADTGNRRVQIFDATGNPLGEVTGEPESLEEPLAVAVTSQDEILVLESELQWIYRYDATGQFIDRFGGPVARLFHPRGLTVLADGTIVVADTGGARLAFFASDGTMAGNVGSLGNGPGQFNEPTDMLQDTTGSYFVVEAENNRLQRIDARGNPLGQWAIQAAYAFNGPHLALGPDGSIFVTEPENGSLSRYAPDGSLLDTWQSIGPVNLAGPVGIYFDAVTNRLYITDIMTHQIHIFEIINE
jgi:DNA-binding beta-propeller fold protein YncE